MVLFMPGSNQKLAVDFEEMARNDSDFNDIWKTTDGYFDFQDPNAVRQLTISTLLYYFNLKIELPEDRLCPAVPVRYEYIRWLASLHDTTHNIHDDLYNPHNTVLGIDIGVGSSCIYPLLGCASRPSWTFHATDIDDTNFDFASRNVQLNNLQDRITLHKNNPEDALLNLDAMGIEKADFVMCNPPFFISQKEMRATYITKKKAPSAVCRGADVEMVTEGGDLGFIMRIIDESCALRRRVKWYSSMFGKKSSMISAVNALKDRKITNWAVTTFAVGERTRRWALAWSFGRMRPRNDIARGDFSIKEFLPFSTIQYIAIAPALRPSIPDKISSALASIGFDNNWNSSEESFDCFAAEDVWSRAARRARAAERNPGTVAASVEEVEKWVPDFDGWPWGVRVTWSRREGKVVVRWICGEDAVLFESFCGWLKRKLTM